MYRLGMFKDPRLFKSESVPCGSGVSGPSVTDGAKIKLKIIPYSFTYKEH